MSTHNLTSWGEELIEALKLNGETRKDIEAMTLTPEQLTERFDPGYGGKEGCAFTVWTKNYVYFPAIYGGSEWIDSVARNPNGEATEHIGGY